MQINQPALDAIFRQFRTDYQAAYEVTDVWADKVATPIPSSARENTYGWLARIPRMREWVGPRVAANLRAHDFTIVNKDFELTIEVDRNKIEDDQLGVFKLHTQLMGEQARKHGDDLLTELIQGNGNGFDGVPFFSDSHPEAPGESGSGTYDNDFALALDAAGANYNTVRSAMMAFNGDDGKPLKIRPSLLVVPPQLEQTARQLLNASVVIDGGGNAGVSNVWQNSADLLVVPEFANQPTVWYLFDTTRAIKPFVWQERKSPEFVSRQSATDPSVFDTKKFLFGVDSRDNVGFSLPFLAARSTG
jgi:phage major head subunit gpT-like protein